MSEYVMKAKTLPRGGPKKAQIALSGGLGRVLAAELRARVPRMKLHSGERRVAGALRPVKADVSESHDLDGLRLAVEIKPVNLAVGRAPWNRFGDIRAFAVNIHLKFPFAVFGGVLVVPTSEEAKLTKKMLAERSAVEATFAAEVSTTPGDDSDIEAAETDEEISEEDEAQALREAGSATYRKQTTHLIERLIRRWTRRDPVRPKRTAHLLEAVAVIVYDPETGAMHPHLPRPDNDLRWEKFVATMAKIYDLRFD